MKSCSVWNLFLIMIHTLSADTARGREASWDVSYCGNTSSKGGRRWGFSVSQLFLHHIHIVIPWIYRQSKAINISCVSHAQAASSLSSRVRLFVRDPSKSWQWGSVTRGSASRFRGRRQTPAVSAKDQVRRLWNVRGSVMAEELC